MKTYMSEEITEDTIHFRSFDERVGVAEHVLDILSRKQWHVSDG